MCNRGGGALYPFDDRGDAHAAADAERDQARGQVAPLPTTSCCCPLITPINAKFTPCSPEPQKRFRDTPVTSCGHCASSTALRAMQAP